MKNKMSATNLLL